MKVYLLIFFAFGCSLLSLGQGFSEDPNVFGQQAVSVLKRKNSAAYDKIAYDFDQAWKTKFTSEHQTKIMQISSLMRKQGYPLNPNYVYLFAYVANGISNENLNAEQVNKVLDVNLNAVQTLNRDDYTNFLFELSTFFGGRYIHISKNSKVRALGGSYTFEMVGEVISPEPIEEDIADEPLESATQEEEVTAEPIASTESPDDSWGADSGDDWGSSNDDWGSSNDDWGSDDSWGSSNDDWGSDDSWGSSSDDDWGSDDSWGTTDTWGDEPEGFADPEPENPKPIRQAIKGETPDYVMLQKMRYRHPVSEGPMIHLDRTQLIITTPYDSLVLDKVEGDQLLEKSLFAGRRAEIDWPGENMRMRGASVVLDEFSVNVDRAKFWTPNATIVFPEMFSDSVAGSFHYQSTRRTKGTLSKYPIFTSDHAGVKMNIPGGKATYTGGIRITGNELFGMATSKEKGELVVLDGKGRTVRFEAEVFEIQDSVVSSKNASITIINGVDSIYHPAVEMEYFIAQEKIVALRTKKNDITPFHSTYHKIAFGVDMLRWDFAADSINFTIMNGKDLLPATFESDQFFSIARYNRLTGPFGFHPIGLSAYYATKYGITEFNEMELASEYDVDISLIRGAMKMLKQYHFAEYDELNGQVKLLPNAFHYYQSASKKKDYDNIYLASKTSSGPNASLNFETNDLIVNGVEKFWVTTDYKISVSPFEGQLVIHDNRNITLNGEIEAGDFDYKGKDFKFNYEEFVINMDQIDSIRIQIPVHDSTGRAREPQALSNHITETSGTLYLSDPENRSGNLEHGKYPYFISETDGTVYFDGQEYLDGAYDKTVRFIIPPMEVDEIDSDSAETLQFPGTFNSGGIFPEFRDTLKIMPDRTLGFIHQIPERGYNLYGTPARTYETVTVSSEGIKGLGKIDFLKAHIFSDEFIYYPDSVTANAHFGTIDPGSVGAASFPQAELGTYRMYWLPRVDSMYLITIDDPFSFYNGTAQLTGAANITQKGVYGSGSMLTRGSIAESDEMEFKELTYSARHAEFEVLSDDPEKPAMAGDDIRLHFDLTKNIADVSPEVQGVAAISFPYAQMKTSITNAVWYLEDSIITMTKPEAVDIANSYFYTTREDLDSLAFNATNAIYDIKTYELNVQGIPFIQVADAKITPDNNETVIKANSDLEVFQNALIVFEYPEATHYLKDGVIDVISRNEFSGKATYLLPIDEDTFEIEVANFYLEERYTGKDDVQQSSKATGEVDAATRLAIAPGFNYKGGVTLHAYKQALELDGYVKPMFPSKPNHDNWLNFSRTDDETEIILDFTNALYEDGDPALAGLHFDRNGKLYTTFVEKRNSSADDDLFVAKGQLRYNHETGNFLIEDSLKSAGEQYEGHTMIYTDSSQTFVYEGEATFVNNELNPIEVKSTVLGTGNGKTQEFTLDGMFTFDFKLQASTMAMMSQDIIDIVERLGNAVANDLSIESMLKLGNFIGEGATRAYETNSLKDYVPLAEASPALNKMLVVSGVKMNWNDTENAWHNTTKLALSNIFLDDINAKVDGFLEFKKDDTGGDVVNLFIQAAPGAWYYFNYQENSVMVFSSNKAFNDDIAAKSNFGNAKPGELTLIAGDENETLKFLNNFRKVYFGIDEPYNLVFPDEGTLEDESFDTIEKDKTEEEEDDGFGF